jgi:allophanate hydrolase subunit 2
LAPHPGLTDGPLRFVAGPDADRLPVRTLERLEAEPWTVAAASDRMGVRLEGRSLEGGDEILSHPLVPGAIQVPPDGRPVLLLVDGPTIGGYPVPGTICRADLPRLGQLRAGDRVRLVSIEVEAARALWREQQARLAAAAGALGTDDLWERLIAGAGG